MSQRSWSNERIVEEIGRLHATGFDITQSRVESLDSRLTSAAIRYFGSWRDAVEAAGIDYETVASLGRLRRRDKITKWTQETIVEEIRRLHAQGEDLTSTVVRSSHLSLYATARRKDHFGSWSAALAAAGIDYAGLKQDARERRRRDPDWTRQLLADLKAAAERPPADADGSDSDPATPLPGWARDLVKERLSEIQEGAAKVDPATIRRLSDLARDPQG